MNIQRWKGIVWLGSLAVGGFLVYYVYDFLQAKEQLAQEVSDEELSAVLDSVKKPVEQKTDVVEYPLIQKVFHDHDWTGKEKEKPKGPGGSTGPTVAPKIPVSQLLKVLAIKVDTTKPENGVAYVTFIDGKLLVHKEKDDTILRPAEHLFAPYEGVKVDAITDKGVVFSFGDGRDPETVQTAPYSLATGGIVVVGPEGAIQPQLQSQIGAASLDVPVWRPEQMMQVRKNEFQVGTGTLEELDRDYSIILSRDISYSNYKNPRTGASEGIKINSVRPDSIPAQAGLSEGEVLKSINGHKVTSVNDAIAFVKASADTTDTWTALFEKQGREFTRTYRSPPR
ncbi:MAG: hypothetical protein EXS08_04935 [Planctomycetes bacterium]|nr:hypothetical protein [Planctomycetota bacterium]